MGPPSSQESVLTLCITLGDYANRRTTDIAVSLPENQARRAHSRRDAKYHHLNSDSASTRENKANLYDLSQLISNMLKQLPDSGHEAGKCRRGDGCYILIMCQGVSEIQRSMKPWPR